MVGQGVELIEIAVKTIILLIGFDGQLVMLDCLFQIVILLPVGVTQVALGHGKIRIDVDGCLPSFRALCIALLSVEEIAQIIMSFVVSREVFQRGLQNRDTFQAVGKNIVAFGMPCQLELPAGFCSLSLEI